MMKKNVLLYLFAVFVWLVPAAAFSGVQLGMEVNPKPVKPGERMNVALTVTNDGTTPTGVVTLELVYPLHLVRLDPVYVTTGGESNTLTGCGYYCDPNDVLSWNLGSLKSGGGVTVTLPPLVSSSAVDGDLIQFDAVVKVGGNPVAEGSEKAEVASDPLFTLAVDENADPVRTTDLLEYAITYGNASSNSSGTRLVFPLPSGTSFVSATGDHTVSPEEVSWDLGSLASGAGGEHRVTVQVNAGEGFLLEVDGASITGTDSNFVAHTVFADRVTRVENEDRPKLGIAINPNPVKPNWRIMTDLTVTNPGETLLSNVELILRYPRWVNRLDPKYVSTGGESNTLTGCGYYCEANELVRWNLGSLRPGGGVAVTLPQFVWESTSAGTLIRFEAEIRVDGVQQLMESTTARVASDPIFTLGVDEDADPVGTTGFLGYTLTYGNASTNSSGTQLVFPLPSGTSFVSATGDHTVSAEEVSWDLGSLASGAGGEHRVIVQVNAGEGFLLEVDGAFITGTDSNYVAHTVFADRVTRVEDGERPNIGIAINPNPVKPNGKITTELTVANPGNTLLSNVELILRYPWWLIRLDPVYVSTGGESNTLTGCGYYCEDHELVRWNLGSLRPGGGVTVTLPQYVRESTPAGTLIRFEAEIRVDGVQQMIESRTTRVASEPLFTLALNEDADPVGTTDLLEYTLTYGNTSRNSSNTQLVFPLPPDTSFVSATGGGTESGGEVTWNLGSLASGAGDEHRVTVRVNADEGDLLEVDGAYISGIDTSFITHTVFADRVTRVENDERPKLGIAINPNPVRPNYGINTELTVVNPGNTLLSNVELILRYPVWLYRLDSSYVSTGGESNALTGCGSYCENNELMRWNLGSLRPGGGVAVNMRNWVGENAPAGSLIPFQAEIRVDGRQQATETRTVRVASDPMFSLTVDGDADPVGTSGLVVYTLTYGNISTNSSDTRLVFPLPSGTSFVSSTGAGTESAEHEVIWDLGSLPSGAGGERRVTVQVNAGEGDLLEVDGAYITGTDSGFVSHTIRVDHATRVEDDNRPSLMMSLNPSPVEPGAQMDVGLTVTNSVGSLLSNVELILRYPGWLNWLSSSNVSTGGESNTLTGCGSSCENGELMRWNLNTLPPGGEVTVTMPPTVRSDAPEGTRILFDAEVRVDGIQQLSLSETVFVGTVFNNPGVVVIVPGDVDDNEAVNIADAIAALQIVAGLQPNVTINRDADVDGDTLIGLPEAIYSLQVAAQVRNQ
jgi:hypothetical protein